MWNITQQQYEALLDGPALQAPEGWNSNLDNPKSLGVPAAIVASVSVPLATLILVMRLFTKVRVLRRTDWEDYVSIGAWATLICYFIVGNLAHHRAGVGVHQWDMTVRNLEQLIFYYWVNSLIYCVTVFLIKLAILLQFMTLFASGTTRGFTHWASHGLIWTNAVFYFTIFFVIVFICTPIDRTWHRLRPGAGRCLNTGALYIAMAVFNTISDFAILLVPQRVVWRLKMSPKRKSGLSAIFFVGIIACIASLVRLYYSVMVARSDDYSYWAGLVGLSNYFEMWAGITATCLPILPRFLQAVTGRRPAQQPPSYNSSPSASKEMKSWPLTNHEKVSGSSNEWSKKNNSDDTRFAMASPPRMPSDKGTLEDRKYGIRPSFYDASAHV